MPPTWCKWHVQQSTVRHTLFSLEWRSTSNLQCLIRWSSRGQNKSAFWPHLGHGKVYASTEHHEIQVEHKLLRAGVLPVVFTAVAPEPRVLAYSSHSVNTCWAHGVNKWTHIPPQDWSILPMQRLCTEHVVIFSAWNVTTPTCLWCKVSSYSFKYLAHSTYHAVWESSDLSMFGLL